MTSNEFILQCREISALSSQGQAGLDLDVYDLVTDSVRDVKSLSGGESFMAALSMALGLADIVQNTAGAVSLETMFVDEGFGSLDDAARERAIQILKELAGEKGLVGIISHVNELKEQIDWKLKVTKMSMAAVHHGYYKCEGSGRMIRKIMQTAAVFLLTGVLAVTAVTTYVTVPDEPAADEETQAEEAGTIEV